MRAALVLVALGALVTGQLAFGGGSQPAAWTVHVGEQGKPPAGTPKQVFLNQFFPGRLTVNAGDRVTFSSIGFHTVSYLGGKRIPNFVVPPRGKVYEGVADSAGQPFFFDGQQKFEYNPAFFAPSGPKAITRGAPASSGVIAAQNPRKPVTATFTFPQVGTFKLLCLVHPPDMSMTVVVKPRGAAVPAAEDVAAQAKAQTDAAWAKGKALAARKPPANTVLMGVDGAKAAGGRTTLLDFVPNVSRVKAGTTVTFRVAAPTEVHNAAFGPLKYLEALMKKTDLFPMGPNAPNQVTPFFIYGSDEPGTPYDGKAAHGNGFYATPLGDGIKGGLPNAYRVTFANPGKYHFVCLLHGPDMAADIVVRK
ncbi:MAG TPA: hypothetical protein VNJ53_03360 [Gaiellaceae bacterium]|nr:hypothetical protein [Gaiellaceae bacterium]